MRVNILSKNYARFAGVLFIACVCGWFIMELEILGVRMLTPYFGSAVYVVTGSVIGIFLLSMSAGYMLGGWISTQQRARAMAGANLIVAGVCFCALPFLVDPVCEAIFNRGFDEKWGSLLATLILFGLPTMLLATISPTMVRLLTERSVDAGFNTGLVLTASTVASFAGCVVTAFYLVLLSLRHTIWTSGGILIVLGVAVLLYSLTREPSVCKDHHEQTDA